MLQAKSFYAIVVCSMDVIEIEISLNKKEWNEGKTTA